MFNAGHVTVDSTDPVSLSKAMMAGRKVARQFQEGLAEYEPKVFASSYLASTASLMESAKVDASSVIILSR